MPNRRSSPRPRPPWCARTSSPRYAAPTWQKARERAMRRGGPEIATFQRVQPGATGLRSTGRTTAGRRRSRSNFEAAIGFLSASTWCRASRGCTRTRLSTLPFFSRLLLAAPGRTPLSCATPESPVGSFAQRRRGRQRELQRRCSTCSTPPRCWCTSGMARTLRNRCARTCAARVPAGALCWRDGALYRPAKIRVPRYGAGAAPAHLSRSTSAGDHACITPASHNPR